MHQYCRYCDTYGHEECYPSERWVPSEWSLSPSTSATSSPMTREPSGESAITMCSSDAIQSPSSEYGTHDSVWSPLSESGYDMSFPPTSFDPIYMSEANQYVTDGGNYCNAVGGFTPSHREDWWQYYDFIANVESGQEAYWRLKPGYEATADYPETRAPEDHSATVPRSQSNDGLYLCLETYCTRRFKRKADLERHYSQKHTPADKKTKFPCDWKRCQRGKDPFHRIDHQRDHYREYHHEDLMRRNGGSGKEDESWWASRKFNPEWWRCARCLHRVYIQKFNYKCPTCKTSCENERQYRRSRQA